MEHHGDHSEVLFVLLLAEQDVVQVDVEDSLGVP